jgi:hypothetical protein
VTLETKHWFVIAGVASGEFALMFGPCHQYGPRPAGAHTVAPAAPQVGTVTLADPAGKG